LVSISEGIGLAASLRACACAAACGLGRRHDAVDQADLERGLGHERLAQQQRLGGAVVAEHLRHQQAGGPPPGTGPG
jgi:hypothetical protein